MAVRPVWGEVKSEYTDHPRVFKRLGLRGPAVVVDVDDFQRVAGGASEYSQTKFPPTALRKRNRTLNAETVSAWAWRPWRVAEKVLSNVRSRVEVIDFDVNPDPARHGERSLKGAEEDVEDFHLEGCQDF